MRTLSLYGTAFPIHRILAYLFIGIACLALILFSSACSTLGVPESPAAVADTTVLDEQAALGVETLYSAYLAFAESAVDVGLVRGERAGQVLELTNRIAAVVEVARSAYNAGQSTNYFAAIAELRTLISEASGIIAQSNAEPSP